MQSSHLFFLILLTTSSSLAASQVSLKGVGYKIEPIAGLETLYRETPKPHTTTRAIVGARAVLGVDALSGELEYTRGSDTEDFTTDNPEKIFTSDEKGKLGLRSTYRFNDYFFMTGRLGGQGTRGYTEETNAGVITRKEKPLKYYPYAGASLGIRFGAFFSLSAGTTVVFVDKDDMGKNEIQNMLSISLGINN